MPVAQASEAHALGLLYQQQKGVGFMTPGNYNAYKRSASQTTHSKEEILIMLYDGALKFIKLAGRGIDERKPEIKGQNISKVIAILTELEAALDMELGGTIAKNLEGLYTYMIRQLSEANIKNDKSILGEVSNLISEIKDGFVEASKTQKKTQQGVRHFSSSPPTENRRVSFAV